MRLLHLLAEALSAEKEAALRNKFVQVKDKENPMAGMDPNKISEKEFKALLDIDETPNGTYLNWIIPRYVKMDRTERQRFFNDGHNEQVKELLVFFDKNKQRIKKLNIEDFQADINLYKTLRDFENVLGTAKATIEGGSEDTVQAGPEKYKAVNIAPIKILGTTPSGFVVYKIPQSCNGDKNCYNRYLDLTGCGDQTQNFSPSREKEEAPKGGYAVKWCTRGSMFDSYLKNGPYYLFKNWNTRRQYQLHYESGQLKDEADKEINGYNGKLQQEFLQFLLDNEGRIPSRSMSFNLNLDKFKVGDVNGYPILKVGPAYYIDAKTGADQQNKLVYYDADSGLLKNADGTQAGAKNALKNPYFNLCQFLLNNNLLSKEAATEDAWKHWLMIRILGNINIPKTARPNITGNANISGVGIKVLPDNLTITGDFNISNNPELTLPPGLKVGGVLDARGTKIKNVPPGTAGKVIVD